MIILWVMNWNVLLAMFFSKSLPMTKTTNLKESRELSSELRTYCYWVVPLPSITVTTRMIISLAGDPYEPSFPTFTGAQPNICDIKVMNERNHVTPCFLSSHHFTDQPKFKIWTRKPNQWKVSRNWGSQVEPITETNPFLGADSGHWRMPCLTTVTGEAKHSEEDAQHCSPYKLSHPRKNIIIYMHNMTAHIMVTYKCDRPLHV